MVYLLDINLLVALFDSRHVNHEAAHRWFGETGHASWATCPIVENGVVRVLSNPAYPTITATPVDVLDRMRVLSARDGHVFWPDDVSLLNVLTDDLRGRLQGHQQVTDFYLVCLALAHKGRLATFDGTLSRSVGQAGSGVELLAG